MTELNPQVKQIRVPLSVWTLAHYVLRTGCFHLLYEGLISEYPSWDLHAWLIRLWYLPDVLIQLP